VLDQQESWKRQSNFKHTEIRPILSMADLGPINVLKWVPMWRKLMSYDCLPWHFPAFLLRLHTPIVMIKSYY